MYYKIKSMCLVFQIRTLRLRLLRTNKIGEAGFDIRSVQDDQAEIKLSSGSILVDLLHRANIRGKQGIVSLEYVIELHFCSFPPFHCSRL